MSRENEDFIRSITHKFLRHLGSVERMMDTFSDNDKEAPEKEGQLGNMVSYVLHMRADIIRSQQDGDLEKSSHLIEKLAENIERNQMIRMIDKKIEIELDSEGLDIQINSGLLRKAYTDHMESTLDSMYDDSQFRNSLIVSLVIGLEMLIAEIFKDFILNVDITNQVLKDRKITFELLKEIGSVDEAKHFLIDQYIEKLLRDSFTSWIDEFNSIVKINLSRNPWIREDIKFVNETFQRRHLIIHNDGVINDLYLNKIDSALIGDREKGDELFTDEDYIINRLATVKKFGLILIYLYGCKKHRREPNEMFSQFHNSLVLNLTEDYEASRLIFKHWKDNEGLELYSRGICITNYFLTYKLNNDDSINKEIEEFDPEFFGEDFALIKLILLQSSNATERMISFLEEQDDDEFIHALTWPLMKLVDKTDEFEQYVKSRVRKIANEGWEDEEDDA